jgi:hypothetical protein
LPDDPVERAKIVLDVFGLEAAAALLEQPAAVEALNLFFVEGTAPSVLGEKLATLLLGLTAVVETSSDAFIRVAKENFGWSPQRAGKFVKAFDETIAKAAAVQAAPPAMAS